MMWLLALWGCVTDAELHDALDRDGDGFLPGVSGGPDCDETRADVHPDAPELCGDGIDNDCDGWIDDDGIGALTWYRDVDGDGHGAAAETVTACVEPPGFSPSAADCDDSDPAVGPDAEDLCDGIDQDCDGVVDDDGVFRLYFEDADGDGVGVASASIESCSAPEGWVQTSGDCDDTDNGVRPGTLDGCDGRDEDCDGAVDEDAELFTWYADGDGDGVGAGAPIFACAQPSEHVDVPGDCDDTQSAVRPGAADLCDGVDQDCDGQTDEDADFSLWYADADGDGFGDNALVVQTCDGPPADHVGEPGDCDDTDPLRQVPVWYRDADGDGFGSDELTTGCEAPPGFVADSGDCDDTEPLRNPGLEEVCNNHRDDDCSDETDCRWTTLAEIDAVQVLPFEVIPVFGTDSRAPHSWLAFPSDGQVRRLANAEIGPDPTTVLATYACEDAELHPDTVDSGLPLLRCGNESTGTRFIDMSTDVVVAQYPATASGLIALDSGLAVWVRETPATGTVFRLYGGSDFTQLLVEIDGFETAAVIGSLNAGGIALAASNGAGSTTLVRVPETLPLDPLVRSDFSGFEVSLIGSMVVPNGDAPFISLAYQASEGAGSTCTHEYLLETAELSEAVECLRGEHNVGLYARPVGDLDGDGSVDWTSVEFGISGLADVFWGIDSDTEASSADRALVAGPLMSRGFLRPAGDINDDGFDDAALTFFDDDFNHRAFIFLGSGQ